MPQAIAAFLESVSYEDAVRNAVSLGGDSDTLAAITGSVAWSYYGCKGKDKTMSEMLACAKKYLPEDFISTIREIQDLS